MKLTDKLQGWHYALMCYMTWGMFPIYWAPLYQSSMPAEQLLAQRVIWSMLFAIVLVIVFRQTTVVLRVLKQPKVLGIFLLSAFMIGLNWLVYLWALVNQHILDASLGYFINPLLNVFVGRLVLKERLNITQFIALCSATVGILWLAIPAGQIPWIALILAGSFALYGLIRKLAPMSALSGFTLETLLMLPFALGYLYFCHLQDAFVFIELTPLQITILLGSGIATALPLIWFATAAKKISMSLLGMLQYISPTLQFLCGVLLFGETLSTQGLIGYAFVWFGVIVFLVGMQNKCRS
ncbi:DMT superfamily drug/metabolite transporter [Bibersteinia trehalosi USDA-ARS-USMARC-188]|uniref:DMT superfamily drug/metabolite transporter n=2 Tax=Bibersteinia trehalosi TaxID=47735 RepID=A0A4V7ICF7_BIBTR|nr:EamA family transporter RarD [Bibersteinia trehalosi]AGH37523.1 DMT superfamily drug/metabolite transporter [Bibersteinia trehalosi USDA-ARS-USMARC-192]AHG82668.1 DMT superfamily drug/metabolite transporter [Bibersteinia trehalosi USDA-ARS-USMARC-188]AHG85004.1 DMT superfamily drug/metabolite transporter [Bibersteinia trehalosi USDA-ARS-USMARC-189]TCT13039.1 chloramphenicol-sensitive protein RarD [Bibersteinia trehalosi]